MYGVRQEIFENITTERVREFLELGGRVVYLTRKESKAVGTTWDVVFEFEKNEVDLRGVIVDFLAHVNPATLDAKMLEHPAMDEGVGKAALAALSEMAARGA